MIGMPEWYNASLIADRNPEAGRENISPEGLQAMVDGMRELPLLYLWMARLTSQAKFPGEEEMFGLEKVEPLLRRDYVIGTAEITRWPALAPRQK